ncbi:AEC family transporter [candidate division KSB1 bacterium]|nr:AEC family transporter [candidate division KSB1 bacterium]
MANFILTANIVAPVFLIVLIGFFLKKKSVIDENFNRTASKIVFNITLPALGFQKIASTNYKEVFNLQLILFVTIALLGMFIFSWIVSYFFCHNGKDQGAFIQGSFRSNFAIIGFALISNAFGLDALANAAIILAFIVPLYNVLSVVALTVPMHKETGTNLKKIIKDIITNPLILSAVIALPFSFFRVGFHPVIEKTLNYLAVLTLPLALLSIGGSLSFHSVKKNFLLSTMAAMIKIVLMPLLLMTISIKMGYRGLDLGILFFLFGCPTAVASYIMAEAMGSNGKLAGNIILMTTLGSVFTLSAGIFILKSLSLF